MASAQCHNKPHVGQQSSSQYVHAEKITTTETTIVTANNHRRTNNVHGHTFTEKVKEIADKIFHPSKNRTGDHTSDSSSSDSEDEDSHKNKY